MKYIDAKWHYPKMDEYPIKFGKYTQQNYPQIPCLVLYNGMYGVRFWNCTEECWDDEECDDFFCEKDAVEKWLYIDTLDSLQQEQPEVDLEAEVRTYCKSSFKFDYDEFNDSFYSNAFEFDDVVELARHFYELGLNARKEK